MKEIIDASKKNNNPIIEVKLKPKYIHDEEIYKVVRTKIEKTLLG